MKELSKLFCLGLLLLFTWGCASSDDTNDEQDSGAQSLDGGGAGMGNMAGTGGSGGSGGDEPHDGGSDAETDGGESEACAALGCIAPATCDESSGTATCVCPDGYTKAGVQCIDVDECLVDNGGCDDHATCTNSAGSFTCTCDAPAYTGDGATCGCASGYILLGGECKIEDGTACTGNEQCASGHCVSAVCCASACDDPLPCETATGATCDDGSTCEYATKNCDDENPCTTDSCDATTGCRNENNSDTCDDENPCTLVDVCASGVCQPVSTLDCNDQNPCTDDHCDPSATTDNPCVYEDNSASCDDGNSCTTVDLCASGQCGGSGNACGVNALGCTQGTPNTCSCMDDYLDNGAGRCVPLTDECDLFDPCDPNATCLDLTNEIGDVECTCKTGFEGDGFAGGSGCTDIDECEGNPCGADGSCMQGAPGTYSCGCDPGFTEVQGACVCDLNGTFAMRITAELTWSGVDGIEDAGTPHLVAHSWALRRHNYDSDGKLEVETIPCGGTSPDICGTSIPLLLPAAAYAQFLPVHIWELASMPKEQLTMELVGPLPGSSFVTPQTASLLGIGLNDPLGPWPASRAQVGLGAQQVNGAVWVNHDDDGKPGVTSYVVPPGGYAVDGTPPDPMTAFGATSEACPRSNPNADRLAYNYLPAPEGFSIRRVRRLYVASRITGYFDGSISSCDLIQGAVKGPGENGQMRNEARIQGCVRSGSSNTEVDCSDTVVDFFDGGDQASQQVVSASFVIMRVSDAATCADIRAAVFP